jgi:anti-anti-sigma factor
MPTNIIQIDDDENGRTVLRVSGEMNLEDAELLEKIALDLREESGRKVALDLADLDLLDSEAASVLKRLETDFHILLEGIEIFLQQAVNQTEK